MKTILAAIAATGFAAGAAQAATIGDVDLNDLSFEIADLNDDDNTTFTGTSNGIGWSYDGDAINLSVSNDRSVETYDDLPDTFDDLFVEGDFTITFDQPIFALLVAIGNDRSGAASADFGIAPADVLNLTSNGTALTPTTDGGGLALFVFDVAVTSLSATSLLPSDIGYDFTFFAFDAPIEAMPLPGAAVLMLTGLSAFAWSRSRSKPAA